MITIPQMGYCPAIEAMDLTPAAKDVLKGLVNAYINDTIPAQLTQRDKEAIAQSGVREIELVGERGERLAQLTIMHFTPHNKETHREFLFLAKNYPNGTSLPFIK